MSAGQKIPLVEKLGYTAADAATILFWLRIWDAIFDPIMGVLADRTQTRRGKFRPWIFLNIEPQAVARYHACAGIGVGTRFGICRMLLMVYKLSKRFTVQIVDELAERRKLADRINNQTAIV